MFRHSATLPFVGNRPIAAARDVAAAAMGWQTAAPLGDAEALPLFSAAHRLGTLPAPAALRRARLAGSQFATCWAVRDGYTAKEGAAVARRARPPLDGPAEGS
jgi:hypothetical protein